MTGEMKFLHEPCARHTTYEPQGRSYTPFYHGYVTLKTDGGFLT